MRVARAGDAVRHQVLLVGGIEIHVRPEGMVEILAVKEHGDVGVNVLDVEGFTPARMGNDQVGPVAVLDQCLTGADDLNAMACCHFQRRDEQVQLNGRGRQCIDNPPDTLWGKIRAATDAGDLVLTLTRQALDEVQELAGHVLMNEQNPHVPSYTSRPTS